MPISTVLQKVDLKLYNKFDCALIHNPNSLHPGNLCAGVVDGYQGQCNGNFNF